MKSFKSIFIFISVFLLLITCETDSPFEDFKIYPERYPDDKPWSVETLDLRLLCFETEKECLDWAKTHGYTDYSFIKCNWFI